MLLALPSRIGLGDFDYNGFVDNDDVTLLGVFYNPSSPLPSPLAPVPVEDRGTTSAGRLLLSAGNTEVGLSAFRLDVPSSKNSTGNLRKEISAAEILSGRSTNRSLTLPSLDRATNYENEPDGDGLIDLLSESIVDGGAQRAVNADTRGRQKENRLPQNTYLPHLPGDFY